jgi:hypothetical protein
MHHEDEIEDKIKSSLAQYEEEYTEGAWENFVLKRNRRRGRRIRLISSLAAAILIPGFLFLTAILNRSDDYSKESRERIRVVADIPETTTVLSDSVSGAMHNVISDSGTIGDRISGTGTVRDRISDSGTTGDRISGTGTVRDRISDSSTTRNRISGTAALRDPLSDSGTAVSLGQISDSTNLVATLYDIPLRDSLPKRILASSIHGYGWGDLDESKGRGVSGEKRKVRFGLNLSPGFNSTSEASSFNYGGGVNVDFKLTDRINLSTGVQLEHQSIDSKSSSKSAAMPSYYTRATLTNLDIPVNITFSIFSDRNSSYYIGGGISSLAFLSEKYRTISYKQELRETISMFADEQVATYRLENIETVTTTVVTPDNTPEIGGRVNLLFGYQQRLTPRLYLNIEPYIKIPVTGMASRDLIYTTGGIMCKISF